MEEQNTKQSEIITLSTAKKYEFLVVDADDFAEDNHRLDLLFQIKKEIPEFKISVFTVLGKCSMDFIRYVKTLDWIDMIPHGWGHKDAYECKDWTLEQAKTYFEKLEHYGLTRGFKAPGWQISQHIYEVAPQYGYWIADQPFNSKTRPKSVSVYELDRPWKKHYHIQNVCDNGLEEKVEEILSFKGNKFKFIKETL